MSQLRIGKISLNVQQLNINCPDTIILIHGLGYGSLAMWYFNIAPALARQYRVVMYDLKSHGKSDQVQDGYDLITLSNELAMLMRALHIPTASIVGFSFGTLIAIKFAERFPQKVNKLALIEAPYVGEQHTVSFLVNGLYNKSAMNEYRKTLDDKMQRILSRSARQIEKHDRMFQYLFDKSTLMRDLLSEKDFDDNKLKEIDKETLLLNGDKSSHLPTAKRLKSLWPKSQIVFVTGGHDIPIISPDEVRLHLEIFFGIEVKNISAITI